MNRGIAAAALRILGTLDLGTNEATISWNHLTKTTLVEIILVLGFRIKKYINIF